MTTLEKPAGSGKVVLGVDDQEENIFLLKSLIESHGLMFFGASSGAECFGLAARVAPKLILLDIQMPGMDGFTTCRRFRAMREFENVPIAFLTARKTAADVKAGIEAGGNDFIVKPFDPEKLLARVDHWVVRRVEPAPSRKPQSV